MATYEDEVEADIGYIFRVSGPRKFLSVQMNIASCILIRFSVFIFM